MNGRAHIIMGGIFGVGVSLITSHSLNLEMICISVVASTFPDFDTGSTVRNKFSGNPKKTKRNLMIGGTIGAILSVLHGHTISLATLASIAIFAIGLLMTNTMAKKAVLGIVAGVIIVAGIYYGKSWLIALGAYLAIAPHTGHRTWTHSIWAVIAMFFIFYGAELSGIRGALVAGMAGFTSHLIADGVTVEGVAFFYPIIPIHFGVKLMNSNQVIRQYVIVAGFAVAMIIFIQTVIGFNNINIGKWLVPLLISIV